jgi:hypothetical protein
MKWWQSCVNDGGYLESLDRGSLYLVPVECLLAVALLQLPLPKDSFECARGVAGLDLENKGEAVVPNYPHRFREDVRFAHQLGDTLHVPQRVDEIFD